MNLFNGGTSGEESACQGRRHKRCGFDPRVGKIPWRRKWQPTPVFLPGKSHGQRSRAGFNPWGHKESDMAEHSTACSQMQFMWGFPGGASGKESACLCRRGKRCGFDPRVGKIPWRRTWEPTLVFLPGKSHGQRSPWGHKELDMTEHA